MKTFKDFISESFSSVRTAFLNDPQNVSHNEHITGKTEQVTGMRERSALADHISGLLRERFKSANKGAEDYEQRKTILSNYTGHNYKSNIPKSTALNKRLIKGSKLSPEQQKLHNTLVSSSHSVGDHLHFYSGTKTDFGEMAKASKDHILHSPAHISSTHSPIHALRFAGAKSSHIIHIHAKPEDKVVHMSGHSEWPGEHETIIPAGTKLKYSHSTIHDKYSSKVPVHVHHFTIHSQED